MESVVEACFAKLKVSEDTFVRANGISGVKSRAREATISVKCGQDGFQLDTKDLESENCSICLEPLLSTSENESYWSTADPNVDNDEFLPSTVMREAAARNQWVVLHTTEPATQGKDCQAHVVHSVCMMRHLRFEFRNNNNASADDSLSGNLGQESPGMSACPMCREQKVTQFTRKLIAGNYIAERQYHVNRCAEQINRVTGTILHKHIFEKHIATARSAPRVRPDQLQNTWVMKEVEGIRAFLLDPNKRMPTTVDGYYVFGNVSLPNESDTADVLWDFFLQPLKDAEVIRTEIDDQLENLEKFIGVHGIKALADVDAATNDAFWKVFKEVGTRHIQERCEKQWERILATVKYVVENLTWTDISGLGIFDTSGNRIARSDGEPYQSGIFRLTDDFLVDEYERSYKRMLLKTDTRTTRPRPGPNDFFFSYMIPFDKFLTPRNAIASETKMRHLIAHLFEKELSNWVDVRILPKCWEGVLPRQVLSPNTFGPIYCHADNVTQTLSLLITEAFAEGDLDRANALMLAREKWMLLDTLASRVLDRGTRDFEERCLLHNLRSDSGVAGAGSSSGQQTDRNVRQRTSEEAQPPPPQRSFAQQLQPDSDDSDDASDGQLSPPSDMPSDDEAGP